MAKNLTYGFEKPYLEEIEKEIMQSADVIYYDDFNNLIVEKKPNTTDENTKCILFAFTVSENAFLVSEIKENGNAVISSLMEYKDEYIGKKAVLQNGRTGYIKGKDKKLECDFGYTDKKTASKYVKCGDALSLKVSQEQVGESIFTNCPSYLMKNIFTQCIKDYYNQKIIFAFIREQRKGAYALGKNVKCDEAYFFTFVSDLKENISFIKKEGTYISAFNPENLSACVLEKDCSYASQYFISSGVKNVCGIAVKKEDIGDGIFKITKKTAEDIKKFIGDCKRGASRVLQSAKKNY